MILENGRLVDSTKEKWISQIASMATWVIFAYNLYAAVSADKPGRVVMAFGLLLGVTVPVLTAPVFRLVDASEGTIANRILKGMIMFGFLIAVTGGIIQLTSHIN
jgi:hypothetical protein